MKMLTVPHRGDPKATADRLRTIIRGGMAAAQSRQRNTGRRCGLNITVSLCGKLLRDTEVAPKLGINVWSLDSGMGVAKGIEDALVDLVNGDSIVIHLSAVVA